MRVLIRLNNLKPGSHGKGQNEIPTLRRVVILRYLRGKKKGKLNLTDPSDVLLSQYGLKNVWNCQIKAHRSLTVAPFHGLEAKRQSVLWKSQLKCQTR